VIISEYSEKIKYARAKVKMLSDKKDILEQEVLVGYNKVAVLEKAQIFIQGIAKETQEKFRFRISEIVQLALDTCWPGEYVFALEFEVQRNRTVALLRFINAGHLVDPTEEDGGGAVDVSSFALRIAAWSLGKTAPIIVIDEPFKWLSDDLKTRAGEIMRELTERLGIQFIMVTHIKDMIDISDKVFMVTKSKGISEVKVR
jgi:DNA repair exonuclease SbcCD ATPase subunit